MSTHNCREQLFSFPEVLPVQSWSRCQHGMEKCGGLLLVQHDTPTTHFLFKSNENSLMECNKNGLRAPYELALLTYGNF